MFVDLYCHVTSELTYEAEVAELEYSIEVTRRGLTLVVEGFSHKLHVGVHTFGLVAWRVQNSVNTL